HRDPGGLLGTAAGGDPLWIQESDGLRAPDPDDPLWTDAVVRPAPAGVLRDPDPAVVAGVVAHLQPGWLLPGHAARVDRWIARAVLVTGQRPQGVEEGGRGRLIDLSRGLR